MAADKVLAKAKTIAAHQLEVSEDDLDFEGGEFKVRGTPSKSMAIQAVAWEAFTAHNLPDGLEPNLAEEVTYDPPNFVFPVRHARLCRRGRRGDGFGRAPAVRRR